MPGAQYDNPNQQVVRSDGSGPADEGTGGPVKGATDTSVSSAPQEIEVEPATSQGG